MSCQDYDGPAGDAEAGRQYFRKRFGRLAQKANQKEREIYIQCVSNPLTLISVIMSPAVYTGY